MRAIALVVGIVVAAIGIGVGIVGGTGLARMPAGLRAVRDGRVQVLVPRSWKVVHNEPCPRPVPPGVIYVDTHTLPVEFCPFIPASPSTPVVVIGQHAGAPDATLRPGIINSIPLWRLTSGGRELVEVPSVGIYAYGQGAAAVTAVNTLSYAPQLS